jgi:hypothetical protein
VKRDLPSVIGIRTGDYAPLLHAWRRANPRTQWKRLLLRGLNAELRPFVTKRTKHLLEVAA